MDNAVPNSGKASDMNANPLNNGRLNNRAARFYWADEEPSPMRTFSIQQLAKASSSDSHFEESPLVIASISAGIIGVAIIIIILVGIWIRSRLFTEVERRSNDHPNNISVRSSMSTLDEEAYVVCMEMDGVVLGSMNNVVDNYNANDATIEMEPKGENTNISTENCTTAPQSSTQTEQCEHEQSTSSGANDMTTYEVDKASAKTNDSYQDSNQESVVA